MSVYRGDQFMLRVSTDAGTTWLTVADLNSFNKSSQRNTQTFPVFQRALPHSVAGAREQTYSVAGFFNPDDAGQSALFAAEKDDTTIMVEITHDGTNGFTQVVKVGSVTYDADPEGLQEVSFDFTGEEASVVVGTGIAF